MNDIAIRVENLSKRYRIGVERHDTLRDALSSFLPRISRLNPRDKDKIREIRDNSWQKESEFWALRDVSFEVKRGEVVGVIGRNGAGKSTLLKILSRITEPTGGIAEIHGRVGSLLEVGTGFHPELTGRENIYLNGAILGMKRVEIDRKFDEIVAFSEIEKFLDTPVKRYSSGMYVRLAFAVAAHLDPEILLVDEVLAVGDAAFQKKCLGKMGDVAGEGRTVFFVSHNMIALQSLCQRAVWLNEGAVVKDGPSQDIVASYLKLQMTKLHEQVWPDPETAPGDEHARIHRVWIEPGGVAEGTDMVVREAPVSIGVEYWQLDASSQIHITLHVYVEQQIVAFSTGSSQGSDWQEVSQSHGLLRSACKIPSHFFNTGLHRVNVLVIKDRSKTVYKLEDALIFDVVETAERAAWFGKEPGVLLPHLVWSTEYLGCDE